MTEFKELKDWNPKKGDAFKDTGGYVHVMIAEDKIKIESWDHSYVSYTSRCPGMLVTKIPKQVFIKQVNDQRGYFEGLWYGWNGGDCPIHEDTRVEVVCDTSKGPLGPFKLSARAGTLDWSKEGGTVAFRIIPTEPEEVYLTPEDAYRFAEPVEGGKTYRLQS